MPRLVRAVLGAVVIAAAAAQIAKAGPIKVALVGSAPGCCAGSTR